MIKENSIPGGRKFISLGRLATLVMAGLWLFIIGRAAFADYKNVDKVRRFYKSHNMDFFGELIADQEDFLEDEKKHAKLELLADDARSKALAQLEKLIQGSRGEMLGELLMRKATLLSDRARTATYFSNNPFKTSKLKTPEIYLKDSIKIFQRVETQFSNHPKMDMILFSIGYNYGELKDPNLAFKYYEKLVGKHIESPLVGDARLAMAEILFDKRKFKDALIQLQEIVKMDHPRLKNFALYKMAWTHYNLADIDSAVLSLEQVIDGVNQSATGHARLELRKEALHDLVTFYSELPHNDSVAKAPEYFARVAKTPASVENEIKAARAKRLATYAEKKTPIPPEDQDVYQITEAQELLFRLTNTYRDQGKHENAMIVANHLVEALGRHPKVPALYRLRAESAEKLRRRELVIKELERLALIVEKDLPVVGEYSKGLPEFTIPSMVEYFTGITYKEKKFKDPSIITPKMEKNDAFFLMDPYHENLSKVAFETFKDFSQFLHGEWSKTQQNMETAANAVKIYNAAINALLNPWRGHPLDQLLELRHHRAELRFALKRYDEAAEDFNWLALHQIKNEKARDEALRGEIASLEGWLKAQPVKINKGALNPVHERLAQAYDRYLSFHLLNDKQAEMAANILETIGTLLREYGKSEESLKRQMFYSSYFFKQKDAVSATKEVLSILQAQMRWEELRDYSEFAMETGHYKGTGAEKDLFNANQFAGLRLLEKLEKEKDWASAQKEFSKFAEKNPDSPFLSQALMKAANAALELKDIELSTEKLEKATNAPDGAVRLQAWLALEPVYRKSYQFEKLVHLYTEVLKLKADPKTAESARVNLKSLSELSNEGFMKAANSNIKNDEELNGMLASFEKFEKSTLDYKKLRFFKSNNNPNGNFKKKADQHAALASAADKIAVKAPKLWAGIANLWVNAVKADLLIELAESIETAAMPQVLVKAAESDRKAYTETLAGQTKELKESAKNLVIEAVKAAPRIDTPVLIENRLNKLLVYFEVPMRLNRESFSKTWEARPQLKHKTRVTNPKEVTSIALKILKAQDKDETHDKMLKMAKEYFESNQNGYAYAIASELIKSKDDTAKEAGRMMLTIDFEKIPAPIKAALEAAEPDHNQRWNAVRWLLTQLNTHKAVLKSEEIEWFEIASQKLLRPLLQEGSDTKLSQAH